MPWTDDGLGPVPRRTEEELLALTRDKAVAARHAALRWQFGAAAVTVVVLVTGLATALARSGGDPGTEVRTSSGRSETSTTMAVTTTVPTLPTSLPLPGPLPTTAAAATTRPPATTVPPTTAPSTTTSSVPPQCASADLSVRATTDQANYARGQVVRATVEVRSLLARECFLTASRPRGLVVTDAAGEPIAGSTSHGDCIAECGEVLTGGDTKRVTLCWRQTRNGVLVPAGTYLLRVVYDGTEYPLTIEISGPAPVVPPTTVDSRGDIACP